MAIPTNSVSDLSPLDTQDAGVLLKILSGVHRGAEISLQEGTTNVGRAVENDVILMDVDLAQNHCEIQVARSEVSIRLSDDAINIWINGECLSQREFTVPVLTPVYIGSLLVVFGDENADWPCDYAADNVIERQNKTVSESHDKVLRMSSQNFSLLIVTFLAVCTVIVVGVFTASTLYFGDETEKGQAPRIDVSEVGELEQFFVQQEMAELRVDTAGDMLKISGRLATDNQLQLLEQYLHGRSEVYLAEVLVDEDLAKQLSLSLKHQGESKLDIRRGDMPGSFVVHGVYENIQLWPRLRDQLLAEVTGIENLMSDLYTPESVLDWLNQELHEAGIVMTAAMENNDSISLKGVVPEDRQREWQRIKEAFRQRFGRNFRFEHVPQITAQKAIRIRSISAGTVPYVVTLEGASVLVGGVLEGGYKVVSIRQDEVLALQEGKIQRLPVEVFGAQ